VPRFGGCNSLFAPPQEDKGVKPGLNSGSIADEVEWDFKS
jgi:hypothetical protein